MSEDQSLSYVTGSMIEYLGSKFSETSLHKGNRCLPQTPLTCVSKLLKFPTVVQVCLCAGNLLADLLQDL